MAVVQERISSLRRPIDVPLLEPINIPLGVARLSEYVHNVAIPRGDLRRGQIEALSETVTFFQNGGRVGYVEQASGYGKSRYMQEVGKGFGEQRMYVTPGETGSANIVKQLENQDIGRVDKDNKQFGHEITVITIQSLNRLLKDAAGRKRGALEQAKFLLGSGLIFADEVHHYLTPKALEILTAFLVNNPQALMIGATATEGYSDEKNAARQFGTLLHRVDLAEAVEEGVLISPRVSIVKTGFSLDGQRTTLGGDYVFNERIPRKTRDKKALGRYLEICKAEKKSLRVVSYLTSIDHAHEYAEIAREMGIPTEVIIGTTKNREDIYERLKNRKISNIATVGTAIESVDLPWLEGIIDLAPTLSMRVARQKFPRPMRNIPGKKAPWIIQVVDDATSRKNKPLVVSEILNVASFENNSVVVPRSKNEPLYDYSLLDLEKNRTDVFLSEGIEADIAIEIIDLESLFKMDLVDKIRLLRQNLLDEQNADSLREQVLNRIRASLPGGDVLQLDARRIGGIQFFDEVSGEYISLSIVMKEILGLDKVPSQFSTQEIAGVMSVLGIEKPVVVFQTSKVDINPEATELLFAKYRDGVITDSEMATISKELREIVQNYLVNGGNLMTGVMSSFKIQSEFFNGSFFSLLKKFGYKDFNREARDKLLEIINTYSEGEQIVVSQAVPKDIKKSTNHFWVPINKGMLVDKTVRTSRHKERKPKEKTKSVYRRTVRDYVENKPVKTPSFASQKKNSALRVEEGNDSVASRIMQNARLRLEHWEIAGSDCVDFLLPSNHPHFESAINLLWKADIRTGQQLRELPERRLSSLFGGDKLMVAIIKAMRVKAIEENKKKDK